MDAAIRFRVSLDGRPATARARLRRRRGRHRHGQPSRRTYQLIRQPGQIAERTFEIEFLDAGVEAFCFTFG